MTSISRQIMATLLFGSALSATAAASEASARQAHAAMSAASTRERVDLSKGWRFRFGDADLFAPFGGGVFAAFLV